MTSSRYDGGRVRIFTPEINAFFHRNQKDKMTINPGDLKSLHELLLQFFEAEKQLDRAPKLIKARQKMTNAKRGELEETKDGLKSVRLDSDRKSLELKSNESKIEDLRARLNIASSNKEFDITKGQIDADTMANSVLEDEILELLEQVEAKTAEVNQTEKHLETAILEEAEFIKQQEEKVERLTKQLEILKSKIVEAEKVVPAEDKIDYQRIVKTKGVESMASVENGVCQGCYVSMTSQNNIRLNTGEVLFCKSCGALIYPADNKTEE